MNRDFPTAPPAPPPADAVVHISIGNHVTVNGVRYVPEPKPVEPVKTRGQELAAKLVGRLGPDDTFAIAFNLYDTTIREVQGSCVMLSPDAVTNANLCAIRANLAGVIDAERKAVQEEIANRLQQEVLASGGLPMGGSLKEEPTETIWPNCGRDAVGIPGLKAREDANNSRHNP